MLYLICLLKRLGSNLCQFLIWQYHIVCWQLIVRVLHKVVLLLTLGCAVRRLLIIQTIVLSSTQRCLLSIELGMLFMDMVHLPPPEALWMLQPFLSLSLLVLPNKQFLKFLDIHPKKIWPVGEWLPPRFYIKKKSSHTDRENSTNPTSTYTQGLITSENDSWADH
jgi:hypothetical protein